MGIEPMTPILPRWCATAAPRGHPSNPVLAEVLAEAVTEWWAEEDSNLRRLSQLIYSQSRLSTSVSAQDCHRSPACSAALPQIPIGPYVGSAALRKGGADGGTRTRNRRFTKPLLCQLSYIGARAYDALKHV